MEVIYEDHQIFKNYILSNLNTQIPITLLIDANICYNTTIKENNDLNLYLDNIQSLIEFLKNNKIFVSQWNIKSNNNLFKNNILFSIFDLLNNYFIYFNKNGKVIFYTNNIYQYYIDKLNNYINIFHKYNNKLKCVIQLTLEDNINDLIFEKYMDPLYIIINPSITQETINNYKQIKQKDLFHFIINKCTSWDDEQILNCLTLLNEMIQIEYQKYDNKLDLIKYLFPIDNNNYLKSPIIFSQIDKLNNNFLNCDLQNTLSIDCKDLSFPPCCGLQHSVFNGGYLKKDNIIADRGINGYLNQRITNSFFQPTCVFCENKYFCNKGCHGYQWEYNAEPCIPVTNLCRLENNILNFLIIKYNELGLFELLLQQNILTNIQTNNLCKLLVNKGYSQYNKYIDNQDNNSITDITTIYNGFLNNKLKELYQ